MAHDLVLGPDPEAFDPLPPDRARRWSRFADWDEVRFPQFVGLQVEEIRQGYARMRLPYRRELNQVAGFVHGGAIATLVDTVVVPAIGAAYERTPDMLTLNLEVQYLGAVREEDAVAEGWVTRRGRSVCFCQALVRTASGRPVATGSLVYKVEPVD